jgi:hypothetical protein
MQETKVLKHDIRKSLLLLVIVLALFGLLRYFEATQGVLTRMFV